VKMRDTPLWSWHVIAGLVILVLLGLHMGMMHINGILHLTVFNPEVDKAPIDWENVAHRGRQVSFVVIYVLLLAAGLFHGLYGLRNILFELNPKPGVKSTISIVLLLVGIVLMVFGTWAAFVARTTALAAT